MRLWTIAAVLGLAASPAPAQDPKPNILFIMSDDHAAATVSAYGPGFLGRFAHTPNIDRIGKEGVRFTNALVTNSICTPSRAAILTGKYSHHNGVYTLSDALDPKTIHLAHRLGEGGYQTALVGKWHLHSDPQGFGYWNILPGQGRYRDPILREMGKPKEFKEGYSEDVVADQSLAWLQRRDKSKPFALFAHFKAPHRPWDPAPRFENLYKDQTIPEPESLGEDFAHLSEAARRARMRIGEHMMKRDLGVDFPPGLKGGELRKWAYQLYMKRYLACVAAVDENVGRLLDYLDKEGLAKDTIVVYTSDQGFFLGEHGWFDKRFMYEPCLTTPLLIRYPKLVAPGQVIDAMALNVDHAPTLLDLAGITPPGDFDGHSYRPLLQGQTPGDWRKSMYYRYYMHLDRDHNVTAHYGVRTDRHTLIYYYGRGLGMKGASKEDTPPEWELFDRLKDPGQRRNVVSDPEYRTTLTELKAELERLRTQLGDSK